MVLATEGKGTVGLTPWWGPMGLLWLGTEDLSCYSSADYFLILHDSLSSSLCFDLKALSLLTSPHSFTRSENFGIFHLPNRSSNILRDSTNQGRQTNPLLSENHWNYGHGMNRGNILGAKVFPTALSTSQLRFDHGVLILWTSCRSWCQTLIALN